MSLSSLRLPQRKALATGLALALSASAFNSSSALAAIRSVTSCLGDNSPGSLRSQIAAAQSNDTVDLSGLSACTITLPTSAINISVSNLTLQGPTGTTIVIEAAFNSSILRHFSSDPGTLTINNLTLVNGAPIIGTIVGGGCIESNQSVSLTGSTVSGCNVISNGGFDAKGGAIYATHDLSLTNSTISGNSAISGAGQNSKGGGVFAGTGLTVQNSTIRDNIAHNTASSDLSQGGGAFAVGNNNVTVENSTISGNQGGTGAGLFIRVLSGSSASITNSTISGNTAELLAGGIYDSVLPLTISNSTIAFNQALSSPGVGAGVVLSNNTPLTLKSTLIANNRAAGVPSDLSATSSSIAMSSTNNLVVAPEMGLTIPGTTSNSCPKLEPLANNGGTTKTHALHSGSPAINTGLPLISVNFDQRGSGFPRAVGAVDIGAYERQANATDERVFFSGFESGCDE